MYKYLRQKLQRKKAINRSKNLYFVGKYYELLVFVKKNSCGIYRNLNIKVVQGYRTNKQNNSFMWRKRDIPKEDSK